ncbi:MAG TPA: ABC transporter substrate-binding protein [candidate division Zixibacteria bacterium]|nr:ABC transporter substrate-binding protein [candidate division Zixibacteria bacterium]
MKTLALALLLLAAPALAGAQARTPPRLGILLPELDRPQSQATKGLREELRKLGYREPRTLLLEIRNTKGDRAALEPAARDLAAAKTDVIFTMGTRATRAAKAATTEIPVVFVHPADPVALGLVKEVGGSGGNLTGVAGFALQATERRLQLLKELIPALRRVVVFYDANDRFSRANYALVAEAAPRLGVDLLGRGVKSTDELRATLGALQTTGGDALFHMPDDLIEGEGDFIFDTARRKKLPSMFHEEVWAIRGATAAYGPDYHEMGRQAAHLVVEIIKGRPPGSLPIQRAGKFELTLNYRTANVIGLRFPPDMLKRADRVIR